MVWKAYRLTPHPGGGFYLGQEGLEQERSSETYPSDSLFAALVAVLAQIDSSQVSEFLRPWPAEELVSDPPFRLSSLFPILGDLPLLPMPRLLVKLKKPDQAVKRLKKLAFVSPVILGRLLAGQAMDEWLPGTGETSKGITLQGGLVWIAASEQQMLPREWEQADTRQLERAQFWTVGTVPRVTIDRQTSSSSIYRVGRTVFAQECGLWLLADVQEQGEWLEYLLHHLADTGIGGDRTSGYGGFRLDSLVPPELPAADGSSRFMTLSRYNPTLDELRSGVLGPGASYALVDVGGWMNAPGMKSQRRRRVRMIEAGSILANTPPTGRLVDVRPIYADQTAIPPHPVYRSGIALCIGAAAESSEEA